MYSANHHSVDMAKQLRQRDIQAAQDYRLARDARAERVSHSSGIRTAATAAMAVTAWLFHVAKAHPHKA